MKRLDVSNFKSDYEYQKAKRKVKKDTINARNSRNKVGLWYDGSIMETDVEVMYYEEACDEMLVNN